MGRILIKTAQGHFINADYIIDLFIDGRINYQTDKDEFVVRAGMEGEIILDLTDVISKKEDARKIISEIADKMSDRIIEIS